MDFVDAEDVRLAVYHRLARSGSAPDPADLAAELGVDRSDVVTTLRALADSRHLTLDDVDRVVMAHPFSTIALGFSVMGPRTLWWGGCAWDAFALPHLVGAAMPDLLLDGDSALVATRCPACGRAHAWNVGRHAPPVGEQVAHFLVPAAHMWDDVVHTCAHQRIFCDPSCVDRWLTATGNARGYVMDLRTLWQLAAHWYDGRLARGYHRRDPAAAADYLRAVGLRGPFWGLD